MFDLVETNFSSNLCSAARGGVDWQSEVQFVVTAGRACRFLADFSNRPLVAALVALRRFAQDAQRRAGNWPVRSRLFILI